jgi:N-acetylmuramate 1-kinase
MVIDNRKALLSGWARKQLADRAIHVQAEDCLVSASDDASFRRYFRYQEGDHSFIFVDAPPEKEDSRSFVTVAGYLKDTNLNAPIVYQADYNQGFMMLSDLGKESYLPAYQNESREMLLEDALLAISSMQLIREPLPLYDETLLRQEMDLFPEWFLSKQLALPISTSENAMLRNVFQLMVENALQQPQVFVHRDFHSRNLMVTREKCPGILDFQDAVNGPVTYDLVSLLRDCYFKLPGDEITKYVNRFRQMLVENGRIPAIDAIQFRRWFDLVGVQRHLKCAGIFSRLNIRDGKSGYLGDIPLVVQYMIDACEPYPELHVFGNWLVETVQPNLALEAFTR